MPGPNLITNPNGTIVGAYRFTHRCNLIALQAANSRLFALRNSHASNVVLLLRLIIKWLQTAAHTAAIEDSLDVFKLTGYSAIDNTNVVTPAGSSRRTGLGAAFPGSSLVTGVTVAGAAAGMTGGTMTKDASPISQLPAWLLLAVPTAAEVKASLLDAFLDDQDLYPFTFGPDEGFEIENRVLLGAAAGSGVYIEADVVELDKF